MKKESQSKTPSLPPEVQSLVSAVELIKPNKFRQPTAPNPADAQAQTPPPSSSRKESYLD